MKTSNILWGLGLCVAIVAIMAITGFDPAHAAHATAGQDFSSMLAEGGAGGAASTELMRRFEAHHTEVKAALTKAGVKDSELEARMGEIEQMIVRRGEDGGGDRVKSWGQEVADSTEYKSLASSPNQRGRAVIQLKTTITTGAASGGAFGPSERVGYSEASHGLPRRRVRFRELLAPGRTSKTIIEYPRQTTRTNAAAMQTAEGAAKGESALAWEMVTQPVRTLAHWIPASKQVLDDAPMLASIIDNELRYMLEDVEELQLLTGSGTGTDLNGVYTQATAFSPPFTLVAPTMIDVLLLAIAQTQAAGFEPDGLTLNPLDWAKLQTLKTTTGEYLGNGPFSSEQVARLWTLPVVTTTAMTLDKFLVSTRVGAQIFDRQDATVEVSTEHSDFFTKNLVAIRAEERLALAVYRTTAFTKGDFSDAITASTTP